MNKKINLGLALLIGSFAFSQVGIGTNSPNASAILELSATDKGLLLPRVADAAVRTTIGNIAGMQVYGLDTNTIWYNNGTAWVNTAATTASNGLTAASGGIKLGGAITGATNITGLTATNKIQIQGTGVDIFNIDGTTFSVDGTNDRVGIGTTGPNATLQVTGTPATATVVDGVIVPNLTGDQLRAKNTVYIAAQTGATVYVTAADTAPAGKTANVTAAGLYFFDGTVWQRSFGTTNNIYTNSGSLTGSRTVTMGNNQLSFLATNSSFMLTSFTSSVNGILAAQLLSATTTTYPYHRIGNSDSTVYVDVGQNINGDFQIDQNDTTRLLINRTTGNVGIGTATPGHPLQMGSGAHVTTAGVWTNASDARLKKNIVTTNYGLKEVMLLNPVNYNMKANNEKQVGFIAQQVKKIIPEVVSGTEGDITKGETLGISYGNLVPVLTKAIQELKAEVNSLKEEIKALKK